MKVGRVFLVSSLLCLLVAALPFVAACAAEPTVPVLEVKDQHVEKDEDPKTAWEGDLVIIPHVTLLSSGWVVLHEAMPDGKLDQTSNCGQARILKGSHYKVKVPLKCDVKGELTIFVVLYNDNPNDRKFTFQPGGKEDLPVEVGGNILAQSFKVYK